MLETPTTEAIFNCEQHLKQTNKQERKLTDIHIEIETTPEELLI